MCYLCLRPLSGAFHRRASKSNESEPAVLSCWRRGVGNAAAMLYKDRGEGALKNVEIAMAAAELLRGAGILITPEEQGRMEVADFGLGELATTGLQILTYVNTERVCAKELVMIPGQTCPEHWHPTIGGVPGKEETFRCRWGSVSLYVPGARTVAPRCLPPAGPRGAIVSEFSTRSTDGEDLL